MSKWTNGSRWNSDVNNVSGFLFSCASNMCADKAIAAHNADIDALTEEIQQFRDAYVHDREIMADNVAQLGSYEARIDALTAERDELQAIIVAPPGLNEWIHEGDKITAIYSHRPAYAKSEADAAYLVKCHNCNLQMIHERECERDELQRRLDAVLTDARRWSDSACYCDFDRHGERTMECEYCEEVSALRAIAEGRDGAAVEVLPGDD